MANKKVIKSVAKAGAMVAKQTAQPARNPQANIKSAQGNTSNAYTPSKEATRKKNISAAIKDAYNPNSNSDMAQYKRRMEAAADKKVEAIKSGAVRKELEQRKEQERAQKKAQQIVDKRNMAGVKQTEARQHGEGFAYKPLPVLNGIQATTSELKPKTVFTGASKHVDDGRTNKQRLNDMLEGLAIGTQSYANEVTARDFMKDLGIDPISTYNKVHGNDFTRTGQVLSDALYEAKKDEHKVADAAGKMVGKAQEYATVNALAESIPALQAAKEFLSSQLGNSIFAENMADALIDYGITDLPLDTIPEIRENIKAGKKPEEIVKDAIKNFGVNTAFNLGLGALGDIPDLINARQAYKSQKDAIKEVASRAKNGNLDLDFNNASRIANDIRADVDKQILPGNTLDELIPVTSKDRKALAKALDAKNVNNISRPNVISELTPNRDTAMQMADSLRQTGWEPQTPQLDMLGNPIKQYEAPRQIDDLQEAKAVAENVNNPTLTGQLGKEVESGLPQGRSQYYDNTLKKTTDPEFYEKNYENLANEDTYNVKTNDWRQEVSNRRIAEDGADVWADRLINADTLAAEDLRTAYDVKKVLEATDPVKAQQLQRAIRPHITNSAQNLNELAMQAKTIPEAQLEYGLARARKIVDDKRKMPGFSDAVNKMADTVEETIKNGDLEKAKELVKKELSDFGTGQQAKAVLARKYADGEQMVLDLIGGYSPDTKSTKELAEEVASIIRKKNGVADFSAKDEAEILNILKMQSEFEKGTMQYKEYQSLAAKYIDSKMPVGVGEKIKTVLYDNMLGNLRTMLTRNAGGNLFANTLEKMQKPLRVGLDKAVSGKTGVRNYIFDKQIASAYNEGFKKGVADQWHDLKTGINTTRSGEEELIDALNNVHTVFKGENGASKALALYDRIVKGTMGMGDRPFYEAEYAAAKKELQLIKEKFGEEALQRVGVPASDVVNADTIIEFWARNRALDACFQNGTLTSNALTKAKEAIGLMGEDLGGAAFGKALQQSSMPFTQVAGNMFSRFTDYIPIVGTLKNAINTGTEVLGKTGLNQKRFVDATSRNLLGLGLGGLGFGLAKNVADGGDLGITGGYSDDPDEKAAQIAAGFQPYAFQVPWGDSVRQFNIDDIPVLGPMTEATSKAYEAWKENEDDPLGAIASGVGGGVSSAVSSSMLQGLNRMFGSNQYSNDGGFGQNLMDVAYSLPGQLIPSLVRQASQVADDYKRDLGDYNNKGRYAINSMLNSTPGRFFLNPKLNSEGLPVLQNQGRGYGSKILENMILPWSMSEPQYSDLVQTAQDIKANSSDNTSKAFPGVPSRSTVRGWMGDDFSEDDYYNIKEEIGKLNGQIGNNIINAPWFNGLTADEQATIISNAYTAINDIARYNNVLGYEGDNKLGNIYRTEGMNAFMDELKRQAIYRKYGVSGNTSKMLEEAYNEGEEAFAEAVQKVNTLKEYGYSTSNKKAMTALENGGIESLDDYYNDQQIVKEYGLSNIDHLDSFPSEEEYRKYAGIVSGSHLSDSEKNINIYNNGGAEALNLAAQAIPADDKDGVVNKSDMLALLKKLGYSKENAKRIIVEVFGWKWKEKEW